MISSYGVSDSVKTTIDGRKGRIIASVFELSSIIEDFRMQTAGGLVSGLNIWLFGLLPSLMTNAEMWIQMPSDSLQSIFKNNTSCGAEVGCSGTPAWRHRVTCSTLREGKDLSNDDHVIGYIQNVMQIRTKLKLRK
jgi:hypothetical protein